MGFITKWEKPTNNWIKKYYDHERRLIRTKAKTVRSYYEGLVKYINKNPFLSARIEKRRKDGFICVDSTIIKTKFSDTTSILIPKR